MAEEVRVEITLVDRKETVYVDCDRYDDDVDGYLVLYRGDRVIGKYRRKDVIGYHEQSSAPGFAVV